MIRISTIFIAVCMVLVAASIGMVMYSVAGVSGSESALAALTALTFLILYNAVSMRLRDRSDVGSQIADLSRGTSDLARQTAEFGRRLAVVEGKLVSAHSVGQDRIQSAMGEIAELGELVRQLSASVATQEDLLAAVTANVPLAIAAPISIAPQNTTPVAAPPEPPRAMLAQRETATPVAEQVLAASSTPPATPVETMGPALPPANQVAQHAIPQPAAAVSPVPATSSVATLQSAATINDAQKARDDAEILVAVRGALEANRIDIYLQPMVTLPQRKVRFYEAVTRLRDDKDQVLAAEDFIGIAETAGLVGKIDHMVMLRCMQVLRRLMVRNKDVGVFCNVAAATLGDTTTFAECIDFLEANRALASSFILEFKHNTFRNLGPVESEHLAALAQRGYRFSIDHVTDLRIEPRELADRGVRYIKVPASLLLDQRQAASSDIHAADLSDLLGRFGIDLIAERIEGERAVVDLLDFDVRFGQGFLFAAPRPLRPEAPVANGPTALPTSTTVQESNGSGFTKVDPSHMEPPRGTGNAALARRAAGPN
jgi:cyclic-di-GMP phosphodiesterase TipF (flagellum assembly factor)